MRKILIASLLALAACGPEEPKVAAPAAPTVPQVQPIDALIAAERAFAADGAAIGWVEAFEKWREPDALMLGKTLGPARDALAAITDPAARADNSLSWGPEFAGVSVGGDFGFTTGPFAGGGSGYYFTVWRKQADGSWKWFYDGGLGSKTPLTVPAPDAPVKTVVSKDLGGPAKSAQMSLERIEQSLAQTSVVDVPATYAEQYSANVRLHRQGLLPAIGVDAARTAIGVGPKIITFTPQRFEPAASGDMAFVLGEARWQGGSGYYAHVWMHESKGWRIVFDQIVPRDLPPLAPK